MKNKNAADPFASLTWADLEAWAGEVIVRRGKTYQREGRVLSLFVGPQGELAGRVRGTEEYKVIVRAGKRDLRSSCTCPYDGTCKHAVALVVEHLKRKDTDPAPKELSRKDLAGWAVKPAPRREEFDDDEEAGADEFAEEMDEYLHALPKEELVKIIRDSGIRHPALEKQLKRRGVMATGDPKKILRAARRIIDDIASGDPDGDWEDFVDFFPGLEDLKRKLEWLMENGHAEDAVDLGAGLVGAAQQCLDQGYGDELLLESVSDCLEAAFGALKSCPWPEEKKILWAIDRALEDGYGMTEAAVSAFIGGRHPKKGWAAAAAVLRERFEALPVPPEGDFTGKGFHRQKVFNWLVAALENAGDTQAGMDLVEREAVRSGHYAPLVRSWIALGDLERAEGWTLKGMGGGKGRERVYELANLLVEIYGRRKDRPRLAGARLLQFLEDPHEAAYAALKQAATTAKAWDALWPILDQLLQSGLWPPAWPVPVHLSLTRLRSLHPYPDPAALLDIHLKEKRVEAALALYDQQSSRFHWGGEVRLAGLIAQDHPDRAIRIWAAHAERLVAQTRPDAYREALPHLKKIRQACAAIGKPEAWGEYAARLREENKRKRLFMDLLDGLEGRPIAKR